MQFGTEFYMVLIRILVISCSTDLTMRLTSILLAGSNRILYGIDAHLGYFVTISEMSTDLFSSWFHDRAAYEKITTDYGFFWDLLKELSRPAHYVGI